MNVIKVINLIGLILLISCGDKHENRWKIDTKPLVGNMDIENVSAKYYNPNVDNQMLKKVFPVFFEQASDSLLSRKRNDSINLALNQKATQVFKDDNALKDSLLNIFERLQYFYPQFSVPKIYTFNGELPYEFPVQYNPEEGKNIMAIGLDWFLGEKEESYQYLGIPDYLKSQMNPGNLKPKVVESIADRMVPYDIRQRKFIERMIYEGKKLVVQDALLPNVSDARKIGYTQEELNWAVTNEAQIYLYFTEEQLFFSDDKRLNQRFLDDAPFSKFFSENDTQSPGKIGAWMGWQICRAYLEKNKDLSLQEFLMENDLQKIFRESGYKPVD